jgi:hypothetical protein
MTTQVYLNDTVIEAFHFAEERAAGTAAQKPLQKIIIDFKVTSEEYHDIAVLLYGMEFRVQVPGKQLDFQAAISNYSTDTTNLYNPGEVADYHLELTEKA